MTIPIITITAKKGGVGKTELTQSLAGVFAQQEMRVLCIDTDSQGSLSKNLLGTQEAEALRPHHTVAAVFDTSREINVEEIIHQTKIPTLDIVPANDSLEPFNLPEGHRQGDLQFALYELMQCLDGYEIVFIDTPPTISVLPVWAALMASTFVISPVQPEKNASESVHGVNSLVHRAIEQNNLLTHLGFIVNIRDMRLSIHSVVEETLRSLCGPLVFDNIITSKKGFKEAAYAGMPITVSDPKSEEAKMLQAIVDEMTDRMSKTNARRAA